MYTYIGEKKQKSIACSFGIILNFKPTSSSCICLPRREKPQTMSSSHHPLPALDNVDDSDSDVDSSRFIDMLAPLRFFLPYSTLIC